MSKGIYGLIVTKNGDIYSRQGVKLKQYVNDSGYKYVCFWIRESFQRKFVHRLVALTYCNPPTNLKNKVVNHIDGNKFNNNYRNLEWCTPRQNLEHAYRTGLIPRGVKPRFKSKKRFKSHILLRITHSLFS